MGEEGLNFDLEVSGNPGDHGFNTGWDLKDDDVSASRSSCNVSGHVARFD